MNKKLTAKIQKLIPILTDEEQEFSSCIAIEPPEKDLILKKGCLYTVFDVSNSKSFNVGLITNIINDILYNSYYHSESISPIQSLEKAIVTINEKISTLIVNQPTEKTDLKEKKFEFNIITSVLWGNVLYVVHYGKGKNFLMRDGDIKEVSSTSEGNFSVASGVVKGDDVMILSTKEFADKYPPEKLLGSALSSNDLEASQACMILKFIVDTEFTENEVVDFNLNNDKKFPKISSFIDNMKTKKTVPEKREQVVDTIADVADTGNNEKPNIKLKSNMGNSSKLSAKTIIIFLIALLVVSVAVTALLKNKKDRDLSNKTTNGGSQDQLTKPFEKNPQPEVTQQNPQPTPTPTTTANDAQTKTIRSPLKTFYDLKLTDESVLPVDIASFNKTIVVVDSASGKLFTSAIDTPKFNADTKTFPGIKNVANYGGNLAFTDNEGYKIYDLITASVKESYTGTFGISDTYNGNIYSLNGTKITKYVKSGTTLQSATWAEDPEFSTAKDIQVAYNIYVLTPTDLTAYTSGQKSNLKITGIDKPLNNPVDLIADLDLTNIYVADKGNNRIVILTSKGEFVKQLKSENELDWNDIRAISVSPDEKTLYLLNGTKVYEVPLTS